MSYTNQTPNYGLPQWLAADKPKFLTDINNAFSTIDTQLKNANDTANAANDSATSALTIAGQAANTAEGAATVAGQAAALAQSVNELVGTLNAKMGTTSIATIGDGTVTGAIDAINTNLSDPIVVRRLSASWTAAAQTNFDVEFTNIPDISGYSPILLIAGYSGDTETFLLRACDDGDHGGDTKRWFVSAYNSNNNSVTANAQGMLVYKRD